MLIRTAIILTSLLVFACSGNGQTTPWFSKFKQVMPLKSSKADVEKLFISMRVDKEIFDEGIHTIFYESGDGKITVDYSTGRCVKLNEKYFNALSDIVLRIAYFPKTPTSFSEIAIKKRDFIRTQIDDDPGWHYISAALGIDFAVRKGFVIYVERFPLGGMSSVGADGCRPVSH